MSLVKFARRSGQGAFIARGIHITIGAVVDGEVELLIEAPRSIAVSRDDDGIARHTRRQHRIEQKLQREEERDASCAST